MTYQNGIELEIGSITLNAVAEAVEQAGGILHNTNAEHNRVYGYHRAGDYGYTQGDSATTSKPVWRVERVTCQ